MVAQRAYMTSPRQYDWVYLDEAKAILDMTTRRINQAVRDGQLTAYKHKGKNGIERYRFDRPDLYDYLENTLKVAKKDEGKNE